MTPNPILKKLGFADDDRVVIIHVDDVGMCHASLQAFADLWDAGTISSGAVMTPCPWFPATAAWARAHPEVDLGVHGTVNAEWDGYRWGPVSTRDRATGPGPRPTPPPYRLRLTPRWKWPWPRAST